MTHSLGAFSRFPGIISKREPIPPDVEECADCGKDLTDEKNIFENKDGEPVCGYCWEKRIEAAEYFLGPE